jgi:hypothetical protein
MDEGRGAWKTLLATIVGGVLAASGGIVGQYYASQFQFSSQLQLQKIHGQRQVFARIMGRKFATKQLYVSRYEALIFSDYHESRWKRSGSSKDSLDLQEALRWMRRSEDLVFEIVKNHQALFEDLGTVRALFPDTTRLRELVERIYGFKALKTSQPPRDASTNELIQWKNESIQQLQAVVDRDYGAPMDELLNYLSQQLPTD